MTKKDIVRLISDSMEVTQLDVKEIVQKTFDIITDTLAKDGRIELRNFGVFEVKKRAPRKARNPRTGEEVMVPARRVVTFRPGKDMEERISAAKPDDVLLKEPEPVPKASPEQPPAPSPQEPSGEPSSPPPQAGPIPPADPPPRSDL